MSPHRTTPAGGAPPRHVIHALAALREAAECLEAASTAGEPRDLGVASALSHVAAARTALWPHGFGAVHAEAERDAA